MAALEERLMRHLEEDLRSHQAMGATITSLTTVVGQLRTEMRDDMRRLHDKLDAKADKEHVRAVQKQAADAHDGVTDLRGSVHGLKWAAGIISFVTAVAGFFGLASK